MNWFWLNVPLMAMFFLATTGIPLWLVLRRPETRPAPRVPARRLAAGHERTAAPMGHREVLSADRPLVGSGV